MSDDAMEFTGERFTPECVREIWYEHWHRYAFVRLLAKGKRVLDAACGEGYGSALLADVATQVTGVDISTDAIAHAKSKYGSRANLRFDVGDATKLEFPENSFDLIVSFETLEHVQAQEALRDGFAKALSADGVLVISSPDKKTYSDERGFSNEFHVKELYRDELLALLRPKFPFIRLYGQKLLFQSAIWNLDGTASEAKVTTATDERTLVDGLAYEPLYFIAVCSQNPLPEGLSDLDFFGDRQESVYSHYNGEVRKNMTAGRRIAELESQVAELRATVAAHTESAAVAPWWKRLLSSRGAR